MILLQTDLSLFLPLKKRMLARENNSHFKVYTRISVSCKTLQELSLLISLQCSKINSKEAKLINKLNSRKVLHDTDIPVQILKCELFFWAIFPNFH